MTKNTIFDKTPLTPGEKIQISLVILLIILILYTYTATKCTLDCNLCQNTTHTLTQIGWKP